jgi:glycosyltransferase involved in cell wall biosynthesis
VTVPRRISVVTRSCGTGRVIGRAIESVLQQGYANVEHVVVVDTAAPPEALLRYPHLRLVPAPGVGAAGAINAGVAAATGEILCLLDASDRLAPGALHRVAQELDPVRGRSVVLGRCRLVDQDERLLGVEHPSEFQGQARVLRIWEGETLPRPAVFWSREAWASCGPLDDQAEPFPEYDLFCRLSARYEFLFIDEVLAASMVPPRYSGAASGLEPRIDRATRVSRRYWGSPLRALYWRVAFSYWAFRWDRRGRAVRLLKRSGDGTRSGRPWRALWLLGGLLLAPDVVPDVILVPALRRAWKRRQSSRARHGSTPRFILL